MSDTEFLNLDDVKPEVRKVITLKGVKYEYKTPTVADFAREMRRAKALKAKYAKAKEISEEDALQETVELMIEAVEHAFPTMPKEVLETLSMQQLSAIRKFMDAQIAENSEAAENAQGNA